MILSQEMENYQNVPHPMIFMRNPKNIKRLQKKRKRAQGRRRRFQRRDKKISKFAIIDFFNIVS